MPAGMTCASVSHIFTFFCLDANRLFGLSNLTTTMHRKETQH